MGLNGAEGLFLRICNGDTIWLPGTSLCDFIFTVFLYSVTFSLGFLRAFFFRISLVAPFLCVIDISLGTCFFICMQGEAIDEVLGFLKSMEQGFMEKVENQELDIV